jgi:hypothetical protein
MMGLYQYNEVAELCVYMASVKAWMARYDTKATQWRPYVDGGRRDI